MLNLAKERIVVTGGAGFLGTKVVEKLRVEGVKEIFIPRSKDYDLVEKVKTPEQEAEEIIDGMDKWLAKKEGKK